MIAKRAERVVRFSPKPLAWDTPSELAAETWGGNTSGGGLAT
jgi:hypothetical protein